MIQINPNDKQRLINTLHNVWHAEASRVKQFGLTAIEDQIRPVAGGWTIPLSSGVPTGSAQELGRVLDHLQEKIEQETHLSVSLFLNPFA